MKRAASALPVAWLLLAAIPTCLAAGPEEEAIPAPKEERSGALPFLAGAALGLASHEAGHLILDVAFDAHPGLKKVEFAGIPFFAITHRGGLSPRREFAISSAGFWVQHGTSEWILTKHPRLRDERRPLAKGMLAFNVLASVAYSGAAFAHAGPHERDTRGMAVSLRVDEAWVGAMVLAPAVLDGYRYFRPQARWPKHASRAVKVGLVLLVLK